MERKLSSQGLSGGGEVADCSVSNQVSLEFYAIGRLN